MLYIQFDILDDQKFEDFMKIYPILTDIHTSRAFQSIEFWTNLIPVYVHPYYNMVDYGETGYDQQKQDFNMLIDYLQRNLEIDYETCKRLGQNKGLFTFTPLGYPYGGMDGLIKFLNTFDCQASEIDSGFGIKRVQWNDPIDFSCFDNE